MTAPTGYATNWNVTEINGQQWLVIDLAQFRIPLDFDPSSGMFLAVAAPNGGLGNLPGLVKGEDGDPPNILQSINFNALAYDDPTPDAASWTETAVNTYQLNLTLHRGEPGEQGLFYLLDGGDLVGAGSQQPGQMLVVNPAANGFVFASQRVGDRFIPGTINSAPSGNPAYTVAQVTIAPQLFDWRPEIEYTNIITATGADLSADLVCRLSNSNPDGGETSGNEIGRGIGLPGASPYSPPFFSGPPPGSPDSWDRIPAGQQVTIFFRVERTNGGQTFTTSATTTRCKVRVAACPTDITAAA